MAEDDRHGTDDAHHDEGRPRTGLRRRLGRLLNQRELAEDTREVLGGVLEMSDRAKTEAVRLVAREARNYLDELKIKEDLLELITSHSLEVQLSVHLKPLAEAMRDSQPAGGEEPEGRRGGRARAKARDKADKAAKARTAEREVEPQTPAGAPARKEAPRREEPRPQARVEPQEDAPEARDDEEESPDGSDVHEAEEVGGDEDDGARD